VHHYDSYTGLNESKEGGLARLVEGITRTKGLTAGKAKRLMYEAKAKHAQAAYQKLLSKARAHYFNGFEKHQVGAHVKKEIAKRDYSVSDHAAYAMLDLDSYLDLRKGIMEGKFDERTDLEKQYGVKYKSSENKK
jgi:hypothetical protein